MVLRHVSVKSVVQEFLLVQSIAAGHAVDRLELDEGKRAATLRLRSTIGLSPRELFLVGCGRLSGPRVVLIPNL